MKINLRRKIHGLAGLAALLPVVVLLCLMGGFGQRISEQGRRELTRIGYDGVAQAARDVYGLCDTANDLLQRKASQSLSLAKLVLTQKGGISTGTGTENWEAVDQVSGAVQVVTIPALLLGGQQVYKSRSLQTALPVVDEAARLTGAAVSVFQKMNDRGDMLRVATSVRTPDGQRATGIYIPAVNPDGASNPLITSVLRGEPYRGADLIGDAWYVAACEPLRDSSGRVSGMLLVGEDLGGMEVLRQTIIRMRIGQSGHVVVVQSKGRQRGQYVISKDSKRDSENIWDTRDAGGQPVVQQLIHKAVKLSKGDISLTSYPWQNPGEPQPRTKLAAITYFEPWDWMISASAYEDEYVASMHGLDLTLHRLMWMLVAGGLCVLVMALVAAIYLGGRLSRPIELVTLLARKIANGDIQGAKTDFHEAGSAARVSQAKAGGTVFRDESEHLLESFRTMTETLDGLISQVRRSGIQVTTSATEIAASARQLEATVAEQAASTREVSATSIQISATSTDLLKTMNGVAAAVSDAADHAESGRGELGRMETEMRQLVKATASISSRLGVINDRAGKISTVVTTINKISDQTALLALNAAIEAEKAGEYGKGFSVVAREISRLADQTAVATQDIENVVKEMQSSVSSGVMEMDKFSEEVRRRVDDVNKIAGQLGATIDRVRDLGPEFAAAREGMNTQTLAAQQISEAMSQLSITADQTRESLGEFKQATEQLNSAVQGLQGQVAKFRIGS